MVQITKENGMQHAGVPFAWVEVQYPDKTQWDETGFYDMVEQHVAALREQYRDYVRADVFGQNPYFRYFRKFKKTYPVMMQFESVLLKGREFPRWNAVTAVPFLAELETHVLTGTHDVEQLLGPAELYLAQAKEPFAGLRGDLVHTYPGDVCARDEGGIIFSMILGFFILGEPVKFTSVIGGALVAAASVMVYVYNNRSNKKAGDETTK